jgi:hypothetical protein
LKNPTPKINTSILLQTAVFNEVISSVWGFTMEWRDIKRGINLVNTFRIVNIREKGNFLFG